MKSVYTFCVLLLCVNLSLQIPRYSDSCTEEIIKKAGNNDICSAIVCIGEVMSGVGCGTYQCAPGKQIGYKKDDNSKVFPECCGGPICKD